MRKQLLMILVVSGCVFAVGSHSNRDVERNDQRDQVIVYDAAAPVADIEMMKISDHSVLNNAQVPLVPESPTVHETFTPVVAEGHTPELSAVARGPTANDQLRC